MLCHSIAKTKPVYKMFDYQLFTKINPFEAAHFIPK